MKRSLRILLLAAVLTLIMAANAFAAGFGPGFGQENHPPEADHPTGENHPGPGYGQFCHPPNCIVI
jgi:hypothetical protein